MEIIPGERIGPYKPGAPDPERQAFWKNCTVREIQKGVVYESDEMSFWFDTDKNHVFQILVEGNSKARFNGRIGIGSTLVDVEKHVGQWYDELDVYLLKDFPGICFALADNEIDEEWVEREASIEYICIFIE